jgi:hypothetical protein
MTATASPDNLAFFATGCPSRVPPSTISFQAVVTDPADLVAFVIVDYVLSVGGDHDSLSLNRTSSLPTGEKVFTGTTEDLAAWLAFQMVDGSGAPVAGEIDWTAYAYGRDGSILATDGPHIISAAPCTPLIIFSPQPLIFVPTPTSTPASDRDCPPGTYFAPATSRCIQIQIVPTKPGGGESGGGNDCSSYGNASNCTTNGCSWDKPTSSCH